MSETKAKRIMFGVLFVVLALMAIQRFSSSRGGRGLAPTPASFARSATLTDAREAAARDGKPILVFATADWCGPCQQFKRGTLSEPEVVTAIDTATHPVLLDVTEVNDDAESLQIEGIPALILIHNGKEIGRTVGSVDASDVQNLLNKAKG